MYILFKKTTITILIASLLLVNCSHTATILKPEDLADASTWFSYYKDQFKVFGDEVVQPEENVSKGQKTAYKKAKESYEKQQTVSTLVGIALTVTIIVGLVVDLDKLNN